VVEGGVISLSVVAKGGGVIPLSVAQVIWLFKF